MMMDTTSAMLDGSQTRLSGILKLLLFTEWTVANR